MQRLSKKQLAEVYQKSLENKDVAVSYLKKRKLTYSNEGYIPAMTIQTGKKYYDNFIISDALILPIFDINKELVMLEVRSLHSKDRYDKIVIPEEQSIYIYNIENKKHNKVVVTEGIFDAKSILQFQEPLNLKYDVVSVLTASVSNSALHYLAYLYDEIITAFDNDKAGVTNAKRLLSFYESYYDETIKCSIFDNDFKDVNEFLIEDEEYFKETLQEL